MQCGPMGLPPEPALHLGERQARFFALQESSAVGMDELIEGAEPGGAAYLVERDAGHRPAALLRRRGSERDHDW